MKKWLPLVLAMVLLVGIAAMPTAVFAEDAPMVSDAEGVPGRSFEAPVVTAEAAMDEALEPTVEPGEASPHGDADPIDPASDEVVEPPETPGDEAGEPGEGTTEDIADPGVLPSEEDGVLDDPTPENPVDTEGETTEAEEGDAPILAPDQEVPPTVLYLNGSDGDDAFDGTTIKKAVKSFERAKTIAEEIQSILTIYVTGTVPIEGDVSLEETEAVLMRHEDFKGYLLEVNAGKEATLRNITIDGNADNVNAEKSLIHSTGTLNITDGAVLQNNNIASRTDNARMGGAVHSYGGTLNMTGGVIQHNIATWGGGVYLERHAVFNMSGGVIQQNQTINGKSVAPDTNNAGAGGGVAMNNSATFNLSGEAEISNNKSEEIAGGVSVGTTEYSHGSNRFYMTGGTIDGNESRGTGGGIFLQAKSGNFDSTARITAGNITNNKMLGTAEMTNFAFGGGGIYVNGHDWPGFSNGHLFLENVIVSDNTADWNGGGYAGCPISNTEIYLTDGGAIYNNVKAASAKDDIFILSAFIGYGSHGGNPDYFISNTMLGGLPYHWRYLLDGTEVPLNQLSGTITGEGVVLNLYTDEEGNANTQSLAKVFITGNTSATRGGGIGSNGDVTIGKPDLFIEIEVSKNWEEPDAEEIQRPERIEVELWYKISGSDDDPVYLGYESVIPDDEGNWKLTFAHLLEKDADGNLLEYLLKERDVPGYTSDITGQQEEGFIITNTLSEKIKIFVEKVWIDNEDEAGLRPDHVTIMLVANGEDTDETLALNAENEWQGWFYDLVEFLDGVKIEYTVREVGLVSPYAIGISGTMVDGFTVTNTLTPDEPDEPDTPDEPDEPDEPDTPDEPDEPDEPDVPTTPDAPTVPDTPTEPEVPSEPTEPLTPIEPQEPEEPQVPPQEPEPPVEPEEPKQPSPPGEPSEPVTSAKPIPKTGQANQGKLWGSLMLLSLAGLLVQYRRKTI